MVFSIGNIITLIIVILILAIYRQIDRNNRSLEKIRRYSDKITGELDRFVDDKTVELKNLAVELDVHQKTGREILKRIGGAEDELNQRAQGIQSIADRISEYDNAVGHLMDLTSKVDENMKRLRDESSFVDSTSKKLKDVKGQLDGMEKRIPGLVDEFTVLNSRELDAVRNEAIAETERRAEEIDGRIQDFSKEIEDFSLRMDDVESRWQSMEDEALSKVKEGVQIQTELMEDRVQTLERTISDAVDAAREEFSGMRAGVDSALADAAREHDLLKASFTTALAEAASQGKALSDEVFGDLKTYITGQARGMEKDMQRLFDAERQRVDLSDKQLSESLAALEEKTAEAIASMEENLTGSTDSVNERLGQWKEDFVRRLEEQASELENGAASRSEAVLGRYQDLEQGIEARMGELDGSVEADQNKRRQELAEFIDSVREELSSMKTDTDAAFKRMEAQAGKGLQELEKQIGSYEEEINYRISRIEKVGDEITVLDENLRQSIDRMVMGVREEFSSAREELIKHIDGENTQVRQRVEEVNQYMSALERDLEELKARAYDNVNEKLQVFEDDFFKDLRDREENIRRQFTDWQEGLVRELEQMGEDHGASREQLAKELSDELKDRLSQIQTKTFQQYEKYEDQVSNYQERINERIGLSERSLEGLEDNLKRQIQDIRQNSQVEFEKEFTEHKTGMDGILKHWEREWEVNVKEQEEKMAQGFRDLTAGMDAANSDIKVWQTRMQQKLSEISSDVDERFNQLKLDADSTVEIINKDFVEQRDAFDSFYLDIQKRSKDLEMTIEQKLRDFRAASTEIREKVEAVQQRLFGKIEEHNKTLMVNLQEIDKQQKNFIAQTKIFDRADSLKMTLQENIEDLKVEIARITAQSKEVKEAEKKFLTIKKMNDEVSSKLSRFLTEKRRIEEMEGDFKKLINLSQSIDIKLDQVTTTHDSLQEVQVRVRALEELEGEVFQKYERLEKKSTLLESTTEGVDKNFQRLADLENGLRSIEETISELMPQVSEVGSQVKLISKERGKTSEAIKLISGLDKMIGEIEERTERMQKAREWLAGTETRLEEVNREAQEQVKLLGSLVKDGGLAKQGKSSSMGARDVVTKLARQGWTVEEIARTTKLSRGEVELILELRK